MSRSIIFDSLHDDEAAGALHFTRDVFRVMLVDETYRPQRRAHSRRSDVTGEITGEGYWPLLVPVTVQQNSGEPRNIVLGAVEWPRSAIEANGAVYFKARGRRPQDDELVAFVDFEHPVVSKNGKFTLSASEMKI